MVEISFVNYTQDVDKKGVVEMIMALKNEHIFMCGAEKVHMYCMLDSNHGMELLNSIYNEAAGRFHQRDGIEDFHWEFSHQAFGWENKIKEDIRFEITCKGIPAEFLRELWLGLKKRKNLPPCASGDAKILGKLENALTTFLNLIWHEGQDDNAPQEIV